MTRQSRLKGRVLGASALLGLSFALSAAIAPAEANKVGVAAAVNPDAFSSLAGAPQSQLNIGKSIFFNERIATTTSGLVQVLLVDGSTFTVGPDSDLVIDKFVYDANKGTGQIAASFSKGVMRFVGGKISKSDNAVTIKTPAGAMAVRGCIVLTQVTSSNFAAVLVYGDYLKMRDVAVYEHGYGVFINFNGKPQVKLAPPSVINSMISELSNPNTQSNNGDTSGKNPSTTFQLFNTQPMSDLISDANTAAIVGEVDKQAAAQQGSTPTAPPDDVAPPCQTDCEGTPRGHLTGYAGGVYVTQDHVESDGNEENLPVEPNAEYGTLANHRADEVDFTFNEDNDDDATNDTFSAKFRLHAGELGSNEGGILIKFGDTANNPEQRRSFINSNGFAALSAPNGITIFHDDNEEAKLIGEPVAALAGSGFFAQSPTDNNDVQSYTHETAPPNIELPEFCTDCTFMKWGVFVAAGTFEDGDNPEEANQRDLGIVGFWVAGDIPAVGDLPFRGTATYAGDAIGQVWTDLYGNPITYTATGDMDMRWDFGKRSGDLKISKFDQEHFGTDGLTFRGDMCAPGVTSCGTATPSGNHFGGKLSGQLPGNGPSQGLTAEQRNLNGFALGSFARGPANYNNGDPIKGSTPQGVMGNWNAGNDRYKASGVFAGTRQ